MPCCAKNAGVSVLAARGVSSNVRASPMMPAPGRVSGLTEPSAATPVTA